MATIFYRSHPVWVRGLKPKFGVIMIKPIGVAPRVGAWIETPSVCAYLYFITSHPVWVRGLKQEDGKKRHVLCASHPVWVRGLKQEWFGRNRLRQKVAPRVGAWIETPPQQSYTRLQRRRTPCGCVD